MNKLIVKIKENTKINFFFKFAVYCENHPPTRHIQYKMINFAHSNKTIMAKNLPLKRFFLKRGARVDRTI